MCISRFPGVLILFYLEAGKEDLFRNPNFQYEEKTVKIVINLKLKGDKR
jgi:hypothetical protein